MPFHDKPRVAGGLASVAHAMDHIARRAGLRRGTKALLVLNQIGGTDCPGCAWPEPADRSSFEFCENGAKAVAEEAMAARADAAFFAAQPISDLRGWSDFELGAAGRLAQPLVKRAGAGHYTPIAWDDAIGLWASEMRAAGPARTALYTSGRASNEAAFVYQLLGRMLGSNNFPDCSNMCHESSGVALKATVGVGKGTVQLDDFARADLILVIGQNPGTNHPRMLSTLREARAAGATIISVNPLREVGLARFAHPQAPMDILRGGGELATEHIAVAIGGDLALMQGVGKALLARAAAAPDASSVLDHAFIVTHTSDFDDYAAHVATLAWDDLEARSGVPRAAIEQLADRYARAERTIVCWAMGLTQQPHAVATIQEIVNVMLLRGNVGRPGAGLCPVRGHSNVQGDRTMGIDHHLPPFAAAMEAAFGFVAPTAPGLDVVGTIAAGERGELDVIAFLGGNLVSAAPDTDRTAAAMARSKLTVHIATKLNRTQLYPGEVSLILPCLGRTDRDVSSAGEQFVTVEDSMGLVHASRGRLPPPSPALRSEVAMLCALGEALFDDERVPWAAWAQDYGAIRQAIAQIVPGFAGFAETVARGETLQLANAAADRDFHTQTGKARFTCNQGPSLDVAPGHLRLMTIRSHDQFNTTIYGNDDRYRGITDERRVIFMNTYDMAARGLHEGQWVDLTSHFAGQQRTAPRFLIVPYDLPRGAAASYFPEANALVPLESVALGSGTPTSKWIEISLWPSEPRA
ncbi:MAG: FdhF/YdeP family oxidoreductase [Myxococcales bacterium]|nr:FdhF/YdeP family oxidoreductase [Myxococcales bacterium]